MDKKVISALTKFKDEYLLDYIAVFGSYAAGTSNVKSDLDLLVSFRNSVSLVDLVRIERKMSEQLGLKVDLVTENSMSPKIRAAIIPDLQVVFDEKE